MEKKNLDGSATYDESLSDGTSALRNGCNSSENTRTDTTRGEKTVAIGLLGLGKLMSTKSSALDDVLTGRTDNTTSDGKLADVVDTLLSPVHLS